MTHMIVLLSALVSSDPLPVQPLVEHEAIRMLHAEAIQVRAEAGRETHPVLDEECCQIAQRWANRMAAEHSMYHGGGEQIIAMGYSTPRDAIRAWRYSGPHWFWLQGSHERCGWGFQRAGDGTCYWAGVFRSGPAQQVQENLIAPTIHSRRFRLLRRR